MPKKNQPREAPVNSAVHDYIFITRHGDDDTVLGFGAGHEAKEAYKDEAELIAREQASNFVWRNAANPNADYSTENIQEIK